MRIETSYDADWCRWMAEILDDAGDFAGIALGSTEDAAILAARQLIADEEAADRMASHDAPA